MSKAQELFDAAFAGPRDPRSEAYRVGVLETLRYRTGELTRNKCQRPYELGTAEADAWFSGTQEGHAIASKHGLQRSRA